MTQRGLLPNFSFAVLAEADAIVTAAAEKDPSMRDRRDFLWCSIDNDDTYRLLKAALASRPAVRPRRAERIGSPLH
jgi:hypothetical protein